jgi:hypothetical protein
MLASATEAGAQQHARIDQMQPAPPESPFFRVEGPRAPTDRVEFALGLTADYGVDLLRAVFLDTAGGEEFELVPVRHALLVHVAGSLTPVRWLNIDLTIPLGVVETGDAGRQAKGYETVKETAVAGAGDPRLGIHVRPYQTRPLELIAGIRYWAPIGSRDAYLSDRDFRLELDLGVAGDFARVLYGCTAGVAPRFFAEHAGDRIGLSCALHVKVMPNLSIGLEPVVALFKDLDRDANTTMLAQVEPLAAARLKVGSFRFGVGAGPGFGAAPGAAAFRALLSAAYLGGSRPPPPPPKPPPDRDLDGILDSVDACPNEAGPPSPDPKRRGCPSSDRDGDHILDENDFCPNLAGVAHPNPKANGCPDTDNDTLPDPIDACRLEPGPVSTGCPVHARLDKDAFSVTPPIEFKDAKLTADSRASLEEIAATMRANPKIDQVSVNLGTKGAKPALSDKRAEEIALALRAGNLDPSRVEIVLREDLKAGVVEIKVNR